MKGSLEYILDGELFIGIVGGLASILISYIVVSILLKILDENKKNK